MYNIILHADRDGPYTVIEHYCYYFYYYYYYFETSFEFVSIILYARIRERYAVNDERELRDVPCAAKVVRIKYTRT